MANRNKNRLLNTLIVLCMIFVFTPAVMAIIYQFYPLEIFNTIMNDRFRFFLVVVMMLLMLLLFISKIKEVLEPPEPPESYLFPYQNFDEIVRCLQGRLSQNGYKYQKEMTLIEFDQIFIYCKKKKRKGLSCFVIVKAAEFTDPTVELLKERIVQFLIDYSETLRITYTQMELLKEKIMRFLVDGSDFRRVIGTLDLFIVGCAERKSDAFLELATDCRYLGRNRYLSSAGILVEENKLYVERISKYTQRPYPRLRKELFQILGVQEQKK